MKMQWAQTFLIAGAIMFSCFFQIENATHHAKWERMYLCDLDNKLGSIEEKISNIEHDTKHFASNQFAANSHLISIKSEATKSRIFLESIEFKMRQQDNEQDVKTQFANGKIGKK